MEDIANVQYKLIKLTIRQIINQNFDVKFTYDEENNPKNKLIIKQDNSLLFDQIERIRTYKTDRIKEMILVIAPKNPKTKEHTERLINDGFNYNGKHYVRFGKSQAQGKNAITAFVIEGIYDELFLVTQLDTKIEKCVTSKYEGQRCLVFSNCTLIDKIPYIVIIDEYKKILKHQFIKYVVEVEKEYTDKNTGEVKKYNSREIKEGYYDVPLSPFDGFGCHNHQFSEQVKDALNLDYVPIGAQIRLPVMKGYSIEVDFKNIFSQMGISKIKDVFGKEHEIDKIDCIWNVSMFKGYGIFTKEYGNSAWDKYIEILKKYNFKLGISKYSHHVKDINLKAKMNFQYLQCLDLWNQKYINHFLSKSDDNYDILDSENKGKIIELAEYSTNMYEKIIKGDKFYSYKFLGMEDTLNYEAEGNFSKAILLNDIMLKDPAIKQFIHRKLKKSINQMKLGKIYCDGFYHTCVGDILGYLQYAAGVEPIGCLNYGEFHCNTVPKGKILSFRSPLVCPSEVNDVTIVENEFTQKWLSHFKDQDVVMLNMYDLSMPRQGGMDEDGDAVYLCNNPIIVGSQIKKTMIIDVDDKITAKVKPYNKQSILEYEMATRDNRIGEITNVATSILNQFTTNEKWKKICDDNISLLRILQGKEIDYQKTGVRWQMNQSLRKNLKQLPWFLLHNYPDKLKRYYTIKQKNKSIESKKDKILSNGYRSPSPLNELCDYITTWEKEKINWDRSVVDTSYLILNNKLDLNDKVIFRKIKHIINDFAIEWKELISEKENLKDGDLDFTNLDLLISKYKDILYKVVKDEVLLANYVIKASYSNLSMNKSLAWKLFGDTIIQNIKENSPLSKRTKIYQVPYKENGIEYLGKYYSMEEGLLDIV